MNNVLKMIYTAITGLLIAVAAQVNGADCYPSSYCVPRCDTKKDLFNVKAELLYWRPELCGLEGAFGNTTIATTVNDGVIITTVTESDEEPKFKWNTGFRISAEAVCDYFDVETNWTHFKGKAKFHDGAQNGRWNIKYDAVDATFGHRVEAGTSFYFRPFIGVRGVRIHQSLKAHLETLFTSSLIGNNTVFSDKDDSEKFRGVGPLIGLKGEWLIGCDFCLYGSIDVVTYYGDVHSRNLNTDIFTATASVCNGKKKHCFNSVATDLALGICWDKSWCASCYEVNFMLNLGLEQHRIYDFSELGSDGTLSLDGAVFGAGLGIRY